MTTGAIELQRLIYQKLSAAGLNVLDAVGENEDFPYITIGEMTSTDESSKLDYGAKVDEEIHIWSESDGFKEVKELADSIKSALNSAYYNENYQIDFSAINDFTTMREDDGAIRHGVIHAEFFIFEK